MGQEFIAAKKNAHMERKGVEIYSDVVIVGVGADAVDLKQGSLIQKGDICILKSYWIDGLEYIMQICFIWQMRATLMRNVYTE